MHYTMKTESGQPKRIRGLEHHKLPSFSLVTLLAETSTEVVEAVAAILEEHPMSSAASNIFGMLASKSGTFFCRRRK